MGDGVVCVPVEEIEFKRTSGGVLGEVSGDVEQLDFDEEKNRVRGSDGYLMHVAGCS